ERLDQARLRDDGRRGDRGRNLVVADAAEETDPVASFELRAQRAVAGEGQRPVAEVLEGSREAQDVLARRPRADAEKGWAADVRPEAARGAAGVACEIEVAALPAGAPVEDGSLDVVAALRERALDLGDERPEIGIVRPGIHLRDEQDPHARKLSRFRHAFAC